MYDPIIFDLDGTLLNTLGDLAAAGNFALERLDFPTRTEDEFRLFVGNGIPKLIERMMPESSSKLDREKAHGIFSEYYGIHSADMTRPYPGITELLTELRSHDITAVCCTNKDHKFAAELLKGFFGDGLAEVIGAGQGFPRKPEPDAVIHLAEKYKKPGCKPLYVGDSSVDMQTAKNAGITACGVLWGFRDREELESYSPRYIAETVSELRQIIFEEKVL